MTFVFVLCLPFVVLLAGFGSLFLLQIFSSVSVWTVWHIFWIYCSLALAVLLIVIFAILLAVTSMNKIYDTR